MSKLSLSPQVKYQERDRWISFYPKFEKLCLRISPASYFDERSEINICLTTIIAILGFTIQAFGVFPSWMMLVWITLFLIPWGHLFIHLPIYSGIDECDHPQYGFYLYSTTPWTFDCFVWCWGKKTYHFDMPWHWDWVRTSVLRKDGKWEHEVKGDRKSFYEDKWNDILWVESYPYTYKLNSGKIQERTATIKVEEREWRWTWFKAISPRKINKCIDIKFSDEVGERSGSWKGGTIGCSYTMLPAETPLDTLRRMEKERKF